MAAAWGAACEVPKKVEVPCAPAEVIAAPGAKSLRPGPEFPKHATLSGAVGSAQPKSEKPPKLAS